MLRLLVRAVTVVSVLTEKKLALRSRALPAVDWHISSVDNALTEWLSTGKVLILVQWDLGLTFIILALQLLVAVRLILVSADRYRQAHWLLYRLDLAPDLCLPVSASRHAGFLVVVHLRRKWPFLYMRYVSLRWVYDERSRLKLSFLMQILVWMD